MNDGGVLWYNTQKIFLKGFKWTLHSLGIN